MMNITNPTHYDDVIVTTMASQITSLTIVYSIVHSDADQRKYQNSASLASVQGIHRWPVNIPHKGPVTRKMFPFDDVIMSIRYTPLRKSSRTFSCMCHIFKLIFWYCYKNMAFCNKNCIKQFIYFLIFASICYALGALRTSLNPKMRCSHKQIIRHHAFKISGE